MADLIDYEAAWVNKKEWDGREVDGGPLRGSHINAAPLHTYDPTSPPGWMARGACGGSNAEAMEAAFDSDRAEAIDAAKRVCATCPVIQQCLEFELAQEQPERSEILPLSMRHGVWGGATPRERFELAKGAA